MATITKLEAVNRMLAAIKEQPVASVTGTGSDFVEMAIAKLELVSSIVQAQGWTFNTLYEVELTLGVDNTIEFPDNTLAIIRAYSGRLLERVSEVNGKLFDVDNNTDEWTDNVTVDYIVKREWENLPFWIQNYIMAKSAQEFQMEVMGSKTADETLSRQVREAFLFAKAMKIKQANKSIYETPGPREIVNPVLDSTIPFNLSGQ